MKKSFTVLLPIIYSLITFYGCSPSSNSLRYSNQTENEKEDKDSVVRFTSLDDDTSYMTLSTDSLCCDDEILEIDDPGDLPEQENSFDISELMNRYGNNTGGNSPLSDQSNQQERVIMEIVKYMNTPYKFGGNSINGIDCSAFTQTVFRDALAVSIHRSAREQFTQGEVINEKTELKFGDLVFFNTRRRVRPGHVGIYIGDNLFAHASTKKGVTISSLDHTYYAARYMGARRIENGNAF
ncbi:MAG: C40 family peptidase [Ignavibacteriaceae bacterium]